MNVIKLNRISLNTIKLNAIGEVKITKKNPTKPPIPDNPYPGYEPLMALDGVVEALDGVIYVKI